MPLGGAHVAKKFAPQLCRVSIGRCQPQRSRDRFESGGVVAVCPGFARTRHQLLSFGLETCALSFTLLAFGLGTRFGLETVVLAPEGGETLLRFSHGAARSR